MSRFDEFLEFQSQDSTYSYSEFWQEKYHHQVMAYFNIFIQQHQKDYPRDEEWLRLNTIFILGFEFREWLAQQEVLQL